MRGKLFNTLKGSRTLANIFWMSSDRIVQMVLGIVSSAFVARYLGTSGTGILSYVKSFSSFFLSLAVMGLSNLSIRYFVSEKGRQGEVMGCILMLRFIGASLASAISAAIVLFLNIEDEVKLFLLMSSAIYYFGVFECYRYWFNAIQRSKIAVVSGNIIYGIYAVLCIVFIGLKLSIFSFVILYIGQVCIAPFAIFIAYQASGYKLDSHIRVSKEMMKRIFGECWPLIIGTVSTSIYMRIDQVMLKSMTDNATVGIYSVAATVSELWYFIPTSIAVSLLPRASKLTSENAGREWQKMMSGITLIGYTAVIGTVIFSGLIVRILYGNDFMESVPIICILSVAGVFMSQAQIRGDFFIARGLTKSSLKVNVLGACSNVILNALLIPLMGSYGAAIATLLSYIIYAFVSSFIFKELRGMSIIQAKALLIKGIR